MPQINGIFYDYTNHRLRANGMDLETLAEELRRPLSVILQITRRCHFNCEFCSEKVAMADPTISEIKTYASNLKGVQRVFLSGGEPLTRTDFREIVDIFKPDHIIGLPTNAIASEANIETIKNNRISVNVGLDGPRNITSRVRGDYDYIMKGIMNFIKNDISFSLTSVVLRSTMDSVLFTCQLADALGAKKVKFVLPIPKGNALNLDKKEFITNCEAATLCDRIAEAKLKYGWKPTFTFTVWNQQTNGYSILVYPNGKTYAWPAIDEEDKVLYLGDIHIDSIEEIWRRYPFKRNHINKYLGNGITII